jgi:hypothetical protein
MGTILEIVSVDSAYITRKIIDNKYIYDLINKAPLEKNTGLIIIMAKVQVSDCNGGFDTVEHGYLTNGKRWWYAYYGVPGLHKDVEYEDGDGPVSRIWDMVNRIK